MTAMTGATGRHDRFRALAATALDFPLDRAEAADLAAHLATCPACARLAAGLRADAALLRHPSELPTSYRLDTAIGAAIAGRRTRGQASRTLLVLAATMLLGVALLGAALVGAYLWRTLNPPNVLVPSPPPVVVASPDPSASPGPAVPVLAWELAAIPPMVAGGNAYPTAVTVGDTGFVGVGGRVFVDNETPSGPIASAWRSDDGLAWAPAATDEGLALGGSIPIDDEPAPGIVDVAWGPAGYVAVGIDLDDAGRRAAAIWHSDDGATWERMLPRGDLAGDRDFADYQARVRPAAVTWDGSAYVMVGVLREEGAPRAAAWRSTDGRSFNQVPDGAAFDIGGYVTLPAGYATGGPADVAVLPDGSLIASSRTCTATADMEEQTVCRPFVLTSRDGTTWLREDLPGDVRPGSAAAARDRVVVLAGADDGGAALVEVRDAGGWRLVQPRGVPSLARVVAYRDGFLAVSIAGDEVALYASTDGESWSRLPGIPQPPDVAVLRMEVDLATDGSTVVVVGSAETESGTGSGGFAIVGTPPAVPPEPSPTPAPPTWTSGQILVDLGEPSGVRILGPGGDAVADAPPGSLGPMAAWSPDGSRVAVTVTADGEQAVVVVDVGSGAEVARLDGAYAPTWSPDGARLAYCRGQASQVGAPCPQVWLAAATGTGAERLGGGWHGPLAWSPDGRWLLGRGLGSGTPGPLQLIDIATGTATPLGDPTGCYDDPTWRTGSSAAGGGLAVIAIRDLACTGSRPTPTVVVALDVATGREARLTDGTAADAVPAVSPDGRRLAVSRCLTGEPGGPYAVVVMAADGSDPQVLEPDGATDSGPAWSPDGAWILVMRESFASGPGAPLGLHVVAPDGSTSIAVPGTAGATAWAWRPTAPPPAEP